MFKLFSYQLPFKTPLKTSSGNFSNRNGLIITFEKNGITAFGEVAPLPGFSEETLEDCMKFIFENKKELNAALQKPKEKLFFDKLFKKAKEQASLKFGIDSLRYDLLSKINNQSLHKYLFNNIKERTLNVNGVMGSLSIKRSVQKAQSLVDLGFNTLKIKVGVSESEELELIEALRIKFPDLKIRIDANKAWSIEEAIHFLNKASFFDIEYCEEPLKYFNLHEYKNLKKATKINIGIDESLGNKFSLSQVENELPFSVGVIKPMMIGSFSDVNVTIDYLSSHDINSVLTTSLESIVGRTVTAILTMGWGAKEYAHGLSTGSMFKYDLASVNEISNGYYNIPKLPGIGITLNYNYLKRIL